ncbi:WXG100 family type VII secretion target [Williamsia deligens]|uniref:WXG100 family type VII secretion target n=1 Tax=Williamsia deligens TaxID=321325 RepID=A0ABW3G7S6_9NOCA|nr:WXG100 family type VII secretion target [Williamsia deligens]MCP2192717.1 WXG100 family type VII secretion target [Williamsia deligens]
MAKQFTVATEELADIVADMARFDSDAEAVCRDADQTVTRLHGSWTGEAADAQRAAHEKWTHGAAEMRSAVADLRKAGDTAHTNYTAAVKANQEMWG